MASVAPAAPPPAAAHTLGRPAFTLAGQAILQPTSVLTDGATVDQSGKRKKTPPRNGSMKDSVEWYVKRNAGCSGAERVV